jgi:hypothetical protein
MVSASWETWMCTWIKYGITFENDYHIPMKCSKQMASRGVRGAASPNIGIMSLNWTSRKQKKIWGPLIWLAHILIFLEITFDALPFLGHALRNYKNTPVCYLSHRHPLKHPTRFYFYNVRYLSHRQYFLKFLIFPTSVT